MEEQNAAWRTRSSSSPPSPDRGAEGYRPPRLASPLSINHEAALTFSPQSPIAKTELVWCTKREASAEAYPALRHLHEGSGRQGVFLLGKINPGQLMMLPEAESVWEITSFGQSWTQAAQVIPPVTNEMLRGNPPPRRHSNVIGNSGT